LNPALIANKHPITAAITTIDTIRTIIVYYT
jgi:hypothetical protein